MFMLEEGGLVTTWNVNKPRRKVRIWDRPTTPFMNDDSIKLTDFRCVSSSISMELG